MSTTSEERQNVPLFLSDAEMENQARVVTWRGGVTDVSGSIFQTPRSTVDFPRIFNITTKREAPKVLPFSYKTVLKTGAKPKIAIPEENDERDDPPYAPRTP